MRHRLLVGLTTFVVTFAVPVAVALAAGSWS